MEMAQEIQRVRERHGLLGPVAPSSLLTIAAPERTPAKNLAPARVPAPPMPVAFQPNISKARLEHHRQATAIAAKWVSFASKSVLKMLPNEMAVTAAAVLVIAIAFIGFETIHLRKAGVLAVQAPIAQNPGTVAAIVPATNPASEGDPLEKLIDGPQADNPIAVGKDTSGLPKAHVKAVRKLRVKPQPKLPAAENRAKLPTQVSGPTSNPPARVTGSVQNINVASATPPAAKIPVSLPNIKALSGNTGATATLQIQIAYPFAEVEASVWIDNHLTYDQKLFGESKKRALLFKKVEGHEISNVDVPAGEHKIHVRVQSVSSRYDQSQTFVGKFNVSGQNVLAVSCDKRASALQITLR
jgi:hypothetical protein